jgi:hypothetical protein
LKTASGTSRSGAVAGGNCLPRAQMNLGALHRICVDSPAEFDVA